VGALPANHRPLRSGPTLIERDNDIPPFAALAAEAARAKSVLEAHSRVLQSAA